MPEKTEFKTGADALLLVATIVFFSCLMLLLGNHNEGWGESKFYRPTSETHQVFEDEVRRTLSTVEQKTRAKR